MFADFYAVYAVKHATMLENSRIFREYLGTMLSLRFSGIAGN